MIAHSIPRFWFARIVLMASTGLLVGCGSKGAITVFAADELVAAVTEAATEFREQGNTPVRIRSGATADLARAVERGEAADLWLSADPDWTDSLQAGDRLEVASSRVLAWDSLVAVVTAGHGPPPVNQYLLPDYRSIATVDTTAGLAGRCTKQGLTTMGVWSAIRDRVVTAVDARSALALVERGESDAGIVPATLARNSSGVEVGFTLSEGTHDVLAYTGAVVHGARHAEAARRFLDFLSGPSGREILRRHGFLGVGE
jgi:molybdate transport system substrate-binding protein